MTAKLEIRYTPLRELATRFLDRNGKRHDIETIAASIQRYGFRDPLALDFALNGGRGGIAEGNGRLEALLLMRDRGDAVPSLVHPHEDDWAVPVVVGGDSSSESEGMAYAIDHNLTTALGSGLSFLDLTKLYDRDILLDVIDDFGIVPLTIPKDGYLELLDDRDRETDDDFGDLDTLGDDPTEPDEETRSRLGDIWQLGDHVLLCGDSCDRETVDRLRSASGIEAVDLLLTDPPYNVAYEGKTEDKLTIENDSMSSELFAEFLNAAIANADRFMRPGAVFYIWHADSEGLAFRQAIASVDWPLRQCLIWKKQAFVLGRQDYQWMHEPCLYGWKSGAAHLWNSDRTQTTILEFDRPTRNGDHPTMKPIELLAYQIQNSTKRRGVVFDPFLGSGSTLLACEAHGRRCVGVELSPRYCDVIIRRWEELTAGIAVRIESLGSD